jgi:hypothetical protein
MKNKEHTKMRGCKIEFGRDFLLKDVRKAWKEGDDYYVTDGRGKEPRRVSFREWSDTKDALNERWSRYPQARRRAAGLRKKGVEAHDPENRLSMPATNLVTFGAALVSEGTWHECGTWKTCDRDLDLNKCGVKRRECNDKARADCLVFVSARDHVEQNILSKPYYPRWLDEELGMHLEEADGLEEAGMRFE